jgi:hypothetical protein
MVKRMKRSLGATLPLLMLLHVLPLSSGFSQNISRRFQITPYLNFSGFSWKEFSDKGDEDLKESGMLFSFGAIPRFAFTKDLHFYADADLQFYFASVGYEGYLQDEFGNKTPFNTDTGYWGFELVLSLGYSFPTSKSFELTPIGGFAIEYWSRDIGQGKVKQGYVEMYTAFFFNVGVRGAYIINRNIQLSSSILIKMPLTISESVDLSSTGVGPSDISLSPGTNPRFRIQAGSSLYNLLAELYFETWTLSKSPEDRGFHQPESTRKGFGIRIGYTFAIP